MKIVFYHFYVRMCFV